MIRIRPHWCLVIAMFCPAVLGLAGGADAALINSYPSQITVTTSSALSGLFAGSQLVDGSGFGGSAPNFTDADSDGLPEHGNGVTGMHWLSLKADVAGQWVAFDLGQSWQLDTMRIWNYNQGSWQLRSVQSAKLYYSTAVDPDETDPSGWTQLVGPNTGGAFTLARATGAADYDDVIDLAFGGATARHVLIDVQTNYGSDSDGVGLSEVQFYNVPEPATLSLLALPAIALIRRRRR